MPRHRSSRTGGPAGTDSSYPLAAGSRARRLLLLSRAGGEVLEAVDFPVVDSGSVVTEEAGTPEPAGFHSSSGQGASLAVVQTRAVRGSQNADRPAGTILAPSAGHDGAVGRPSPSAVVKAEPPVIKTAVPLETRDAAERFGPIDRSSPGWGAIQRLLEGSRPATWVFTGDSITHGARHTNGRRSFPEHFAERVRWEMRRLLDVVINTGVIGEQSKSLLKNLEWRALRFRPDVVSVLLGLNDCKSGSAGLSQFRNDLENIVDGIASSGAVALLNTPNKIPSQKSGKYVDLPAFADVVAEVARERKLPLVDHWTHWERVNTNEQDLRKWLSDDRIHPGIHGHRAMAKLLFKSMGIFDPRSPTCAVPLP